MITNTELFNCRYCSHDYCFQYRTEIKSVQCDSCQKYKIGVIKNGPC